MRKNGLMSGALILSAGAVMAKLFSAMYRIVLTRILGGEGVGVYQLIFPFYSLCVTLATAGLPMAISKVIAKNRCNEKNILTKCFKLVLIVSIFLGCLLAFFSKGLSVLQGNEKIFICYLILSPSILIVGVSSVLRGYFQGKHKFTPTAVSNIIEQFIKMFCGIVLTISLIPIGIVPAVVGAVVAILVSEVMSLVILFVCLKKRNNRRIKKKQYPSKRLFERFFQ